MSKLPVLSGRDLVRTLEKVGFQLDRQKGSHMILSVPDHRELDRGTLRALLRQASLSPDALNRLM